MAAPLLFLIIFTVVFSAFGQLAMKLAVQRMDLKGALEAGLIPAFMAAAASPFLWAALFIYVVSVALWLWVLSEADLSLAYPFVSLGFLVTLFFAIVFLNESVTFMRVAGTCLIMAGCFFVAHSA